jgi:hypothetical protein
VSKPPRVLSGIYGAYIPHDSDKHISVSGRRDPKSLTVDERALELRALENRDFRVTRIESDHTPREHGCVDGELDRRRVRGRKEWDGPLGLIVSHLPLRLLSLRGKGNGKQRDADRKERSHLDILPRTKRRCSRTRNALTNSRPRLPSDRLLVSTSSRMLWP